MILGLAFIIVMLGLVAVTYLMYPRQTQRTTYGPTECEACGLADNLNVPSYDEWEPRSKLEGKDFGRYYDRDGNPIDFAMWVWRIIV